MGGEPAPLQTITDVRTMQEWADAAHVRGRRIAFVPTMGYLHAGHLSLVKEAQRRADLTVVSIFVNPLQFSANEDLDRYPRDIERDTALLSAAGTDVLFLPDVASMYPEGFQTAVTVDRVTRGLCGAARPGHFRGVTTVVAKLFLMVKPHVAVFGCKDFQQLVATRRMATDLNFDIEIVGAPIVREADGVAMSSRNAYLSSEQRVAARCLSAALGAARAQAQAGGSDGLRIVAAARRVIADQPLAQLEYAALVDPETLEPLSTLTAPALLAVAVCIGKTRLIDNCILSPESRVERRESGTASDAASGEDQKLGGGNSRF